MVDGKRAKDGVRRPVGGWRGVQTVSAIRVQADGAGKSGDESDILNCNRNRDIEIREFEIFETWIGLQREERYLTIRRADRPKESLAVLDMFFYLDLLWQYGTSTAVNNWRNAGQPMKLHFCFLSRCLLIVPYDKGCLN